MASAIPPSSAGVPPNTRLNGWKEIAAHFGRGVRTVQRWEKAFGMPVHRIGTGRGENVHAFGEELDAWLATAAKSRDLRDQPGDADAPEADRLNGDARPDSAGSPGNSGLVSQGARDAATAPASRRGRTPWAVLVAAVAVCGAVTAAWLAWGRPPRPVQPATASLPQPSYAKVDGDTLRIYDVDAHLLWSQQFAAPLSANTVEEFRGGGRRLLIEDINGDGSREVVVFGPGGESRWAVTLYCFDAAGNQLWTRTPKVAVQFGEQDFRPPWAGNFLFTTGSGRNRAIWSTWIHTKSGLFPCLVERLSAVDGAPLSEYWSAGYVNFLGQMVVEGRPSILIGAANNDHRGASLAVFDSGNVNGSAPADSPDKTCRNCRPGRPRAFLVFPRLDVSDPDAALPSVFDVRVAETGESSVWVSHPSVEGPVVASYQLDRGLRPVAVEALADHGAIHKRLENAGKLDHPFGERDRQQLWPVLIHDGKAFVEVSGAITR